MNRMKQFIARYEIIILLFAVPISFYLFCWLTYFAGKFIIYPILDYLTVTFS